MLDPEDRFKFIHQKLPQKKHEKGTFSASELEGEIVQNLKLLKGLIRSEKVVSKTSQHALSNRSTKTLDTVKETIVDELFSLDIPHLAKFEVPKKYHEECYELLISAWRKKIQHHYPQTLTFEKIYFNKDSFKAFIIALSLNVSLQALNLTACRLSTLKIKLLAVLLKVHPTLTYFHLDGNRIENEGMESLVAALYHNETIQHLSLINTDLSDKAAQLLLDVVKKRRYKTLNLEKNKFKKETFVKFVELYKGSQDILVIED